MIDKVQSKFFQVITGFDQYALDTLSFLRFPCLIQSETEFVFKTDKNIDKINEDLMKGNILGPLDLGKIDSKYKNCIMFAVTEKRTKQEIDKLAEILTRV